MFKRFFGQSSRNNSSSIKPVALLILDGWGLAPPSEGNAIYRAKTPYYDGLIANYPKGELIASGESVGLPANEVGNTEVGHLTMGSGRVIYQDLKRISMSIEDSTFFENPAFISVSNHVKKYKSNLHIMGLVSTGNVHSSLDHLYALIQFCKKSDIGNVYLHVFTDGRDAPPKQGVEVVSKLENYLEESRVGTIASIAGRYYAMDRDKRWDRTKLAYDAIVMGTGQVAKNAVDAIKMSYSQNITDEFIVPTVIVDDRSVPKATIKDNDGVIFFNFRVDRPRQLTMALTLPNFESIKEFDFGPARDMAKEKGVTKIGSTFKRERWPQNLFFVTMTEYQKNVPVSAIAFGNESIVNTLSDMLSKNGLKQLHMAESEKERFVTYYFNGLREAKAPGEEFKIVPSPKVATYDKKPEMSVYKLVKEFKRSINESKYNFIVMNFANPDMVAHTGDIDATIKACAHVDKAVKSVVEAILAIDGTLLLTADHGNAEDLLTFPQGSYYYTSKKGVVNTDHSNHPVPLILVNRKYKGVRATLPKGSLADIAPTILAIMNIAKPMEMGGSNLLSQK